MGKEAVSRPFEAFHRREPQPRAFEKSFKRAQARRQGEFRVRFSYGFPLCTPGWKQCVGRWISDGEDEAVMERGGAPRGVAVRSRGLKLLGFERFIQHELEGEAAGGPKCELRGIHEARQGLKE